ncbi:MAG TPA: tetratricopeptide repeat protein [Chlamydiales bacterium]|nr:tetratricopeptide repeat protein [Chlamydiales bacterium]
MKHFSKVVLASLVVTTPTLNAYPNDDIPAFSVQKPFEIPDARNLSYDEVLRLLELIESDSFEERCSADELDQANRLISFLAMEGATKDEKIDVETSVASLFKTDDCQYAYWIDSNTQYSVQPAIFRGDQQNIILCKSWFKKQWDQTRSFVKKHKKAIIIGAIVVVAVTVVVVAAVAISTSAATAAAGGITGSVGALDAGADHPHQKDSSRDAGSSQEGSLSSSLQEQISTFKETIAQEQLAAISSSSGISMEENGRIIGSLFTHKTIDTLTAQASENPFLSYELQNLGANPYYPTPKWGSYLDSSPHNSTDLAFSTNYSPTCAGCSSDLNTLAYETRGDWALSSGYYAQAVQDFGRAIANDPSNPNSYLGRGVANFELGAYEESIADYNAYVSQVNEPFSVTDFSVGFAKGLPKGIYDSGEGMLQFVTDLACHPVQTGEKVYDSISTLSSLAKSGEWNQIGEALSPEFHQLVSEWDSLSSTEKGELSGYAFGKHGADILLPGATAKVVAKGTGAIKELGAVCKNLQSAEKLLVLEAVAEGGAAGVDVVKVIQNSKVAMAEKLGFNSNEITQLEKITNAEREFSAVARDLSSQTHEVIFTNHALERAIQRGVSRESILDTLTSPLKIEDVKIDSLGRPSQRFIGQKAEVVINPETNQVVSVNPTSTKKFEKLVNEIENVKNKAE